MAALSPTDVAFEGFRLTRERPRALLVWAAFYLAFTAALGFVAYLTLGAQWAPLVQDAAISSDPAAMQARWDRLSPFFAAALPLALLFQSVLTCAVYRAVLRPREARGGYMRLGGDELRMLVLNLILSFLWAGVLTGVALVTTLAASAAATSAASPMVLVGAATTAAAICAGVTILVRLSLAAPMTFAERRLRIFDSWILTRGVFWRLFWGYLLALVLAVSVWLLMFMVTWAGLDAIAVGTGLDLQNVRLASANPPTLALGLAYIVASAFMATCFFVLWNAPAAQAYKDLTGGRYPA